MNVEAKPRGRMRLVKPLALAALGLAALAAVWRYHQRAGDGQVTLYGNVDIREVDMAFRQAGRLANLNVEEGDRVSPGQLLGELDPRPFREAVAVVEAQAAQAAAEVDKLRRGYRAQEIAEAEQAARRAEAGLNYATSELRRRGAVVESGAVTQLAFEQALTARDQAAAELAAARQTLALRREGYRREDIAAAEARLRGARASLAQARTALEDTRLYAPARATILSRLREPGSMVNPGTPVYALSLGGPVPIRAYVGEPDLGWVVPGSPVRVKTDSSGHIYTGRVGFVSPKAEFTPKSVETPELRTDLVYRLRIIVETADEHLRQGMPVTIEIDAVRPAS